MSVEVVATGVKFSIGEGPHWEDGKRSLLFVDSNEGDIFRWFPESKDLQKIHLGNQRTATDFTKFDDGSTMGFPDGMTIDTNDHLWIACFGAASVVCFDPNTGQRLQTVNFPAKRITSCCFGGKHLDEMCITSANHCVGPEEQQAYPESGSLFKVTGLGVKGYPAKIYKGKLQNL